jgi:ribosomal-protein-alanine N-acetyltransferase
LIPLVSSVPSPFTPRRGAAYLERQRHAARDGYGYSFAVARAVDDEAVGAAGLWTRDLDLGRASVGYWVVDTARRQGAAASALRAVARFALEQVGVARLELYVEPQNVASVRTAESVGFVHEGVLRAFEMVGNERRDMAVYSLLPGEAPGD